MQGVSQKKTLAQNIHCENICGQAGEPNTEFRSHSEDLLKVSGNSLGVYPETTIADLLRVRRCYLWPQRHVQEYVQCCAVLCKQTKLCPRLCCSEKINLEFLRANLAIPTQFLPAIAMIAAPLYCMIWRNVN